VRARIWGEAFGTEYPAAADPDGYVSVSELRDIAVGLRVGRGQRLADVGCGRGGPGLWVAAATGATLTGIDLDEVSLTAARRRAEQAGLADRAAFRQGTFAHTGLPDGGADAVMSLDALLFAPDKRAAAAELARITAVGGRLVLTSWDYHRRPAGRPAQVADHRPLLEAAGFEVLSYEETRDWRERQERTGEALLAAVPDLAAESGRPAAGLRAAIEEMTATIPCMIRRMLAVFYRGTTPRTPPDPPQRAPGPPHSPGGCLTRRQPRSGDATRPRGFMIL
jgi:SAM-dependent methyltransferase